MNEVQEFILRRAMQKVASKSMHKVANDEEQNKLKDLPKAMPQDYYTERFDAEPTNDVIPRNSYGEPTGMYNYVGAVDHPVVFKDVDVNKVRLQGAKDYLRGMQLQPGSAKWNKALQFLIQHGKINQYNYLNPEKPMDVPKVNNKIFDENEQKQLQEGGPAIASNNNYKKFSGNV